MDGQFIEHPTNLISEVIYEEQPDDGQPSKSKSLKPAP